MRTFQFQSPYLTSLESTQITSTEEKLFRLEIEKAQHNGVSRSNFPKQIFSVSYKIISLSSEEPETYKKDTQLLDNSKATEKNDEEQVLSAARIHRCMLRAERIAFLLFVFVFFSLYRLNSLQCCGSFSQRLCWATVQF